MSDDLHKLKLPAPKRDTLASELAPTISFDAVTAWGVGDGIGKLTLEALRLVHTGDGDVRNEFAVVAHLRFGPVALQQLKQAIATVEAMAGNPAAATLN